MKISLNWILNAALIVGLIYVALSLFNVHWKTRLRVIGSLLAGVLVLGVLGWSLVRPDDPLAPVTFYGGRIGFIGLAGTALLAFAAGALGCLVAWPVGKEIGLLAAPAGLAWWAVTGGSMRILLLTNSSLEERVAAYGFLKWEGFFWLLLIAAGGLGVQAVSRLLHARPLIPQPAEKPKQTAGRAVSILAAVLICVVGAQFLIRLIAQDVRYNDPSELGSVIGQPGNLQIALAVFVAFTVAAFLIGYFLNIGYVIAAVSAPLLGFYIVQTSCSRSVLEYMTENWAPAYFPNSLCAIMPIQLVSFAAIGSLTGYWIAMRYKKPEVESSVP